MSCLLEKKGNSVAKGLGCVATGLSAIGYLGNLLLFTLIEWSFIVDNWLQFFNPILHFQVLITMLITPFFWMMTGLILLGMVIAKLAERVAPDGV